MSWLQSPSTVILEPPKIKSVTVSSISPSICHDDLSFLNVEQVRKAGTILVQSLRKIMHSFEYIKAVCNGFLVFIELQGISEV